MRKLLFTICVLIGTVVGLQGQAETPLPPDRAMLVVTMRYGAQTMEFSNAYSYKSTAVFDETYTTSLSSNFVARTPRYNWRSVSLFGFSDNRYVLQQLQLIESEGWQLTDSQITSIAPDSEQNVQRSRTLTYQFEKEAQPKELVKEFSGRLYNSPARHRIQIWQQGEHQFLSIDQLLHRRDWQNILITDTFLPEIISADETAFSIKFTGQFIEINLLLALEDVPSYMSYRFSLVEGDFALAEVQKRVGAPCGFFEQATYRPLTGSMIIMSGEESCSVNSSTSVSFEAPSFNRTANRIRNLNIANFQLGSQRVQVPGNRGDFVF